MAGRIIRIAIVVLCPLIGFVAGAIIFQMMTPYDRTLSIAAGAFGGIGCYIAIDWIAEAIANLRRR